MPAPELQATRQAQGRTLQGVARQQSHTNTWVPHPLLQCGSLTHSVELLCPALSPLPAVNCLLASARSCLLLLGVLTQWGGEGPGGDREWSSWQG